jgi:hypothetical protein
MSSSVRKHCPRRLRRVGALGRTQTPGTVALSTVALCPGRVPSGHTLIGLILQRHLGPGLLGLGSEQCSAEGLVEGLVPVGEECAEEGTLGMGQDAVPGERLGECQPDEWGQVTVVGERVRRGGQS